MLNFEQNELIESMTVNPELNAKFVTFPIMVAIKIQPVIFLLQILYIPKKDYIDIMKCYPYEWEHYQNCVEEFSTSVHKISQDYVEKYKNVSTFKVNLLVPLGLRFY